MRSKKFFRIAVIVGILLILGGILGFVAFSGSSGEEMMVYFYPMGGNTDGDSCIIVIGDVEILIDAGPNMQTGKEVTERMKTICQKNGADENGVYVWDYVIVTHPDYDHIAGFYNSNGVWDMFKSPQYKLGTLIDFDTTKDVSLELDDDEKAEYIALYNKNSTDETQSRYNLYAESRDTLVASGNIENYYPASMCVNGSAPNTFQLGNGATITVLNNVYYTESTDEKNMVSVCFLIKYGSKSFLFTGDLEEEVYKGETKLIDNNKGVIPENVTVYKVAHHGSDSSSSQEFVDHIRPEYAVMSACAGGRKYNFPSETVTSRLFTYTDKIYVTSMYSESQSQNMEYYGDVIFITDGEDIEVKTSGQVPVSEEDYGDGDEGDHSNGGGDEEISEYKWEELFNTLSEQIGKPLGTPRLIQDTAWFKANRTDVFNVFTFYGNNNGESNCTLIKYGHTEILIDCGINSKGSQSYLVNKVLDYCTDGVIEYAIVTTSQIESLGGFIGDYNERNESLGNGLFDLVEIETLIEFSASNIDLKDPAKDSAKAVAEYKKKKSAVKTLISAQKAANTNDGVIEISDYFSIDILNSKFYVDDNKDHKEDDYSVCALVTFREKKLLFLGDLTNTADGMEYLMEYNPNIKDVDYYRVANYGGKDSYYDEFIKYIAPKTAIIDCTAGMILSKKGESYPYNTLCVHLDKLTNGEVYLTGQRDGYQTKEVCGDIMYSIKHCNGVVSSEINEIRLRETSWWDKNIA